MKYARVVNERCKLGCIIKVLNALKGNFYFFYFSAVLNLVTFAEERHPMENTLEQHVVPDLVRSVTTQMEQIITDAQVHDETLLMKHI